MIDYEIKVCRSTRSCKYTASVLVLLHRNHSPLFRDLAIGLAGYSPTKQRVELPYCCNHLVKSVFVKQGISPNEVKVDMPNIPYNNKEIPEALNHYLNLKMLDRGVQPTAVVLLPNNNEESRVLVWSSIPNLPHLPEIGSYFRPNSDGVNTYYIDRNNVPVLVSKLTTFNLPKEDPKSRKRYISLFVDDNNGSVDEMLLLYPQNEEAVDEDFWKEYSKTTEKTTTVIKQPWEDKK